MLRQVEGHFPMLGLAVVDVHCPVQQGTNPGLDVPSLRIELDFKQFFWQHSLALHVSPTRHLLRGQDLLQELTHHPFRHISWALQPKMQGLP
jgi:hypothetical protein